MDQSPLENIFWGDGIELRFREDSAPLIRPRKFGFVQRCTDQEMVLEDIFQRSLRDRVIRNAKHEKTGKQ